MMIYCELFDLWTGIDSRLISTTSRVAELSHAPQSHTLVYELIGITPCDAVMRVVIGIDQKLKCSWLAIRRLMACCVDREALMMRGPVWPAIPNWFGA